MKVWKKLTALVLCAACVCALVWVPPAGAAAAVSTFPDVTDPRVGRAVETLRTMGVIDGSGGRFEPNGSLTRAQFCKMAILVMGKGDEAEAQSSRTIFNDVPGKHWARGYVNLAAATTVGGGEDGKGGSRLMMGLGNGSFAPDRAITYGEAVTAVLRILGYTKEASVNWPYGAVASASAVGLDSGFTPPAAGDPITRAQAAMLFCNMLTTPMSGSKELYATTLGTVEKDMMMLSCNTTTQSGQTGAVKLFSLKNGPKDPVLAEIRTPAPFFQGLQGSAVINKDGRFVTFLPDSDARVTSFTTASATNRVLTASDGSRLSVSPATKVWYNGEEKTYAEVYASLNRSGVGITVCYTPGGAVSCLVASYSSVNSAKDGALVAKEPVVGNPFGSLTRGSTDYKIMKNGVEIATSGIRQYDVGAFHTESNTLYVCDFRLTCMYMDAQPNPAAPSSITISAQLDGKNKLDVLDCAVADLAKFKPGESVTLLFSSDGKVAGAMSPKDIRSNALGYVSELTADSATVKLINAPFDKISGKPSSSSGEYKTTLVSVSASSASVLGLSRQSDNTSGALDLRTRTLGRYTLAENIRFFERVGTGEMAPIQRDDITVGEIPASKVAYRHMNYAGEVDAVILNDVTGDRYTYGIAKVETKSDSQEISHDVTDNENKNSEDKADDKTENKNETSKTSSTVTTYTTYTTVTNGDKNVTVTGGRSFKNGQFVGVVPSAVSSEGDTPRATGSVVLKQVEKLSSMANFNLETNRFFSGNLEMPVWEGVQCYNAETKTWFTDKDKTNLELLADCLSYSSKLTVYYDRDPAQGGKVRIVVAN